MSKNIYITHKGEEVKSYGEQEIADFLNFKGIDYWYEVGVQRSDGGWNKPDFYLPEYKIYIEYFGMCHLSKKYDYEMHVKIETYEHLKLKVIRVYRDQIVNHDLEAYLNRQAKKLIGKPLTKNIRTSYHKSKMHSEI